MKKTEKEWEIKKKKITEKERDEENRERARDEEKRR